MTDEDRLSWIEDNPERFLEFVMGDFWRGMSLRRAIDQWADLEDDRNG